MDQIKFNYLSTFIIVISCLNFWTELRCQDITSIKSATPLKLTGSFYTSIGYIANDNINDAPTSYNAGLNLNFNFYNSFNLPLSFAYSNYGSSFNALSFKRFGVSPSYKSLKIHAGHRSYILSPYLMSGLTILGGGLELTPKKFYMLAFFGKVSDPYAVGNDVLVLKNADLEFFDRSAYGLKLGFGKTSNRVGLAVFHAKDDLLSGSQDSLSKYSIRGKENFGVAMDMNQNLFRVFSLTGNAALSVLTNDIKGQAIEDTNATEWINRTSFITTVNNSTRYALAYDGKLSFKIKSFQLGFKYQHIDPFYSSLGINYLQTNYDNYLIDASGNLFKSKLYLASNFGIQYVNKSGFTGLPQKRNVANINANFNFSKSLNLSGNYSNLVQNTNPQVNEVNDSLLFTTNNVGWNGTLTYKIGKGKNKPHALIFNGSNTAFDVVSNNKITINSVSNNYNVNYKYNLKDSWSFGGGLQYFISESSSLPSISRSGILLNAGKKLNSSINLRLNASFRTNETKENKDGYITNGNLALTYQVKKKHNFSLNASQLIRKTTLLPPKNETRFRINYNYNF